MPKRQGLNTTIKLPSSLMEEIVAVSGYLQGKMRKPVTYGGCVELAWKIATNTATKSDVQVFTDAVLMARSAAAKQTKAG